MVMNYRPKYGREFSDFGCLILFHQVQNYLHIVQNWQHTFVFRFFIYKCFQVVEALAPKKEL